MFENDLWLFVVAGGPVVLGVIIAYAMLTRRRKGRAEREQSERATERLYREPGD